MTCCPQHDGTTRSSHTSIRYTASPSRVLGAHLLTAATHAVAGPAEAPLARDGRSASDGAGEVPRLPDHVLLWPVPGDRARLGVR